MSRVERELVEPVGDALPDGVGGGRADAGVDLVVQLVELVLDLGLGLAAHGAPEALAVAVVAERDRADVALVDLVPGDAVVATFTASLRLGFLWRSHRRGSFRLACCSSFTLTQEVPRRPSCGVIEGRDELGELLIGDPAQLADLDAA